MNFQHYLHYHLQQLLPQAMTTALPLLVVLAASLTKTAGDVCNTSPQWFNYIDGQINGFCETTESPMITQTECALKCVNEMECTGGSLKCVDNSGVCVCKTCTRLPGFAKQVSGSQYFLRGYTLTRSTSLDSMVSYPLADYGYSTALLISFTIPTTETIISLVNVDEDIVTLQLHIRTNDPFLGTTSYDQGWKNEVRNRAYTDFPAGEKIECIFYPSGGRIVFIIINNRAVSFYSNLFPKLAKTQFVNITAIGTGGHIHFITYLPN